MSYYVLKYAINDDVSINRISLKKNIFFLLFYEKNMLTKYKWLRIIKGLENCKVNLILLYT